MVAESLPNIIGKIIISIKIKKMGSEGVMGLFLHFYNEDVFIYFA